MYISRVKVIEENIYSLKGQNIVNQESLQIKRKNVIEVVKI